MKIKGELELRWERSKLVKVTLIIFVGLMLVVFMLKLIPWFYSFSDPALREEFKTYVTSLGVGGVSLLLGLQVLQIIVAILPGEGIELLAGIVYGTWGGLLICMIGILIGSSVIFFTVGNLGKGYVEKIFSSKKIKRLSFLQNTKKIQVIIFVLFLIPGTPKDILTYMAPLTKIKASKFLMISSMARIPSVLSSTYAGKTIINGEWWKTAVIFVIMSIMGILGMLINNLIMKRRSL